MTDITEARFDGRCPVCDSSIFEGDEIYPIDQGVWAHIGCTPRGEPEEDRPLCPRCFIYHAGECA